jgi:hypothetical protein
MGGLRSQDFQATPGNHLHDIVAESLPSSGPSYKGEASRLPTLTLMATILQYEAEEISEIGNGVG